MVKTKKGLIPVIMEDVFKFKNLAYNFRNVKTLNRNCVNSVKYRTETITSLTLSWRRPLSYRNQSNQWTVFDMITAFVMKELSGKLWKIFANSLMPLRNVYSVSWFYLTGYCATSDQFLLNIFFILFFICLF